MKLKSLFLSFIFLSAVTLFCQEQESSQEGGITIQKYGAFLNEVAVNDPHHFYENRSNQIARLGEPGNYHYEMMQSPDAPLLLLNWDDALQYCDWCNHAADRSFSLEPLGSDLSVNIDPVLKSNVTTFRLVSTEAYQSGIEEAAVDAGIDEIIEWLIAGAVITAGTEGARKLEIEGTAVTTESRQVSGRARNGEEIKNLIQDFQSRITKAQKASHDVEKIRANLNEQDRDWYLNYIEKYEFRITDCCDAQVKVDEILKVAEERINQCDERRINAEELKPLDADVAILEKLFSGCSSISKDIEDANKAHEQLSAAINNNDPSLENVAQDAQKHWKQIIKNIQVVNGGLQKVQASLQEGLQNLRETYLFYQEDQKKLCLELSRQNEIADTAWEEALQTADTLLGAGSILKSKDIRVLKGKRKSFDASNQEMLKAKQSFEEAEKAAANCLEDRRIYFFQEENQRLRSLEAMSHVWDQKIKEYEERVKENELNTESGEIAALRKAVEAVKAIKEAEQLLTESTKMQWMSDESMLQNAWASDTLNNVFVQKRSEASNAHQKAIDTEKELAANMKQVQERYSKLNEFLSQDSPASNSQGQPNKLVEEIKKSWDETNIAVNNNREAWNDAATAARAARDAKVIWAKNILRLASVGVGNFSLGKATKKEGELLGALWVGLDAIRAEKENQKTKSERGNESDFSNDKKINGSYELYSHDRLKRLRLLSYKPDQKQYEMNFEYRPTDDKKSWKEKVPDKSITSGNGHLTIINPHADDAQENSMSLRFVELTPLQFNQGVYAEKGTELIEEAERLNREALQEQNRLGNIRDQIRVATYEQRETEQLLSEATAIEREQPTIWSSVIKVYEKGLAIAPEDKKEWWRLQIKRVTMQSKLGPIDRGDELFEEIFAWGDQQDVLYADEINKMKRACNLVTLEKEELRNYWEKEIKSLERKRNEEQCHVLYFQAEQKHRHVMDLVTKFEESATEGISQKIEEAKLAWDRVIEAITKMWGEHLEAPERVISRWKQGIEIFRDAKNQLSLSQFFTEARSREIAARRVSDAVKRGQSSWTDAITQSEAEVKAWDNLLAVWQQGVDAIPASRKEFYPWWNEQRSRIGMHPNRAIIRRLANRANEASAMATIAYEQAARAGEINLWNDAIEKNKRSKICWDEAGAKCEECLGEPTAESYSENQEYLKKFRAGIRSCVLIGFIMEAAKATCSAFVFQRNASDESQALKGYFLKAVTKWNQAIEQFMQTLQEEALSTSALKEWCQRELQHAQEQRELCINQVNVLEERQQKASSSSAKGKLHQAIKNKKEQRKRK